MTITTTLITLDGAPDQLAAPANAAGGAGVARIDIEPLRTNAHIVSVGTSTVTADGSGTGVIRELAQPGAATVILDRYTLEDQMSQNRIDPTQLYVRGTNGEKVKVTYYQE